MKVLTAIGFIGTIILAIGKMIGFNLNAHNVIAPISGVAIIWLFYCIGIGINKLFNSRWYLKRKTNGKAYE